MSSLAQLLGLAKDQRAVIITADDLGFSFAANEGIYGSLRDGIATSASLMVPAPWARGAAAEYRGEDIGVHLTLNADLNLYRWGPITQSPSLFDGEGGFPRTIADVWEHADLDEVRREWRAQIERAIYWGFDASHLSAHLGGVELKPEFFDIYLDLAEDFKLPVRLPSKLDEPHVGFPFRLLAAERDVLCPDDVVSLTSLSDDRASLREALQSLRPGVTEICAHPALDTEELRAADPDWQERVEEHVRLGATSVLGELLESERIVCLGYRALRNLMRDR